MCIHVNPINKDFDPCLSKTSQHVYSDAINCSRRRADTNEFWEMLKIQASIKHLIWYHSMIMETIFSALLCGDWLCVVLK